MREYLRPDSLGEALGHLAGGGFTIVAGCTDYYCRPDARPLADKIIDVSGLSEARGVSEDDWHFRIGALTPWSELARARLPAQFDALAEAARQVGGVQIQNAGTLGGNLCNASPAADGIPPLLMLDASVELQSEAGTRLLPLDAFILGNRQTALRPDELLAAVVVRKRQGRPASRFLKLGTRAYQVISIVMVAALLESDGDGRIAHAAVAVGACSPVARRLVALEQELTGRRLSASPLSAVLSPDHFAPLTPVSDVRATAEYRYDAARLLVGRALDELQERLR